MKFNRKKQTIIIAILLISVVCLSIGFAARKSILIIRGKLDIDPIVKASLVRLSSSSDQYSTNPVQYNIEGEGVTATNATINNEASVGPTLSNISVTFNNKSHYQTVTYSFYIRNDGSSDVYLTDVLFLDNASSVFKSCRPKSGGSQSDADKFCSNINVSLTIGNVNIKSESNHGFTSHLLEAQSSEEVVLTIRYAPSIFVDEPMIATFGNIEFVYSSVARKWEYDYTAEAVPTSYTCFSAELNDDEESVSITGYSSLCGLDVIIPSTLPAQIKDYSQLYISEDCESIIYNFLIELGASESLSQGQATDICSTLNNNPESLLTNASNVSSFEAMGIISFDVSYTEDFYPVTKIGDEAFESRYLTSVVMPNTITSIGKYAFYQNNLTEVIIPESVVSIDNYAFGYNQLQSVIIPNNVSYLGSSSFYCNKLKSVSLPSGITNVQSYTFSRNNLESITIPDNITSISSGAFSNNLLTEIVLGNNVQTVGIRAFNNNRLQTVEIGSGIREIGSYAFGYDQYDTYDNGERNSITTFTIHIPYDNRNSVKLGSSCPIRWSDTTCPSVSTNRTRITWD